MLEYLFALVASSTREPCETELIISWAASLAIPPSFRLPQKWGGEKSRWGGATLKVYQGRGGDPGFRNLNFLVN